MMLFSGSDLILGAESLLSNYEQYVGPLGNSQLEL